MRTACLLLISAALASCVSTSEMANSPAQHVYHSAKSRAAIADCLLNRLASDSLRPDRTEAPGVTTIGFSDNGGLTHGGIYLFTIHDEGAGSATELRRFMKANLVNAETCF